ncbi:cation-translocating P-type ATPase [Kribbella shirazensis]|uniref:Magnesium-transporting ATPase (P-type) n=1 Tax=Kribbella shirazensis TaxID=1105143 RepID=A0A7X5VDB7_9ACTN|nr:cation-transporting P-type ATPase [Kribbella shirazensis]NIK59140.1 magnesium-transporting ATPase (P-type) [Kribbella shirazensis]
MPSVQSSDVRGLSAVDASRRLAAEGPNELPAPRRRAAWKLFVGQLTHLFALMLWAAAVLAVVGGLAPLAVAIVVIIILNGVFAFAQEYRADRAAERLRDLLPTRVQVIRDGEVTRVDATQLVRDDLMVLGAGDRVSADLQLVAVHGLAVDESTLTGESVPVRPATGQQVFAGTFVVQGEAEAVVTAVAGNTRLAGIQTLTESADRPPSPLTVELHRLIRVIAVIAVAVGVSLTAVSLLLGLSVTEALLFGVGVMVALVPEGLLPTVTLSLARGAQRMAHGNALVRRLDAVETLGATTYVCTDKTGTLTMNQMEVLEVWTPYGVVAIQGRGYEPVGSAEGDPAAIEATSKAAASAIACIRGRAVRSKGRWVAEGDPMEVAIDVLARRLGVPPVDPVTVTHRVAFTSETRYSAVVVNGNTVVIGAPDALLPYCWANGEAAAAVEDLAGRGRRVLAVTVASGVRVHDGQLELGADVLDLLAVVGLEDPPRPDVHDALTTCRQAGVKIAVVTGDHAATAAVIAREVGLLGPDGLVVTGSELPDDDERLGELLDRDDGIVVARVTPADKLRIARALRRRGHVVAMTGDGVNDAPALREADVGVAMGASGSDVARAAADLVLLDDHFASIVTAIRLGRATFSNVRRSLTYHLADNVAELAPFVAWALSGGSLPLAIGVLQVLALDIGTDVLPALALGVERPGPRVLEGPARHRRLVDRRLLGRAFGVLGLTEAVVAMTAFVLILTGHGWRFGAEPSGAALAVASGTAFAVIVLMQMANSLACRSERSTLFEIGFTTNRPLLLAIAAEMVLLTVFLGVPPVAELLGGGWPSLQGWLFAVAGVIVLLLVDTSTKLLRRSRTRG